MNQNLDDPIARRRIAGNLLKLSPVLFVGAWIIAKLQGAGLTESTAIAGLMAAMALIAALGIHLFGSTSRYVLVAITVGLGILAFLSR